MSESTNEIILNLILSLGSIVLTLPNYMYRWTQRIYKSEVAFLNIDEHISYTLSSNLKQLNEFISY